VPRCGHVGTMSASHTLAPLLFVAAAGCLSRTVAPVTAPAGPEPAPEALVEFEITVAPDEAPPVPAERPAASLGAGVADPVPFRMGAGYAALSRIDLDECRETGLPSGYVRVRATFTRFGYVVRALVASSAAPPPRALDCIAEHLRQTGVPAFDGFGARLSKTYFVEPGSTPAP
jgi:hypothetical protein